MESRATVPESIDALASWLDAAIKQAEYLRQRKEQLFYEMRDEIGHVERFMQSSACTAAMRAEFDARLASWRSFVSSELARARARGAENVFQGGSAIPCSGARMWA
jgi:hypothetical protein